MQVPRGLLITKWCYCKNTDGWQNRKQFHEGFWHWQITRKSFFRSQKTNNVKGTISQQIPKKKGEKQSGFTCVWQRFARRFGRRSKKNRRKIVKCCWSGFFLHDWVLRRWLNWQNFVQNGPSINLFKDRVFRLSRSCIKWLKSYLLTSTLGLVFKKLMVGQQKLLIKSLSCIQS